MRNILILSAVCALAACEPAHGHLKIDSGDSGVVEDARSGRWYADVSGPWQRTFINRHWHTMQATARIRPTEQVMLIDVELSGEGWVSPRLVTHDGWVIASCEGFAEDSPIVCLANATTRTRIAPPLAHIVTRGEYINRPTVESFRVRFGDLP